MYSDAGQVDDCMYDINLFIGFIVQMVSTSKKVLNHHHADPFPSERVEYGHTCLL